MLHCDPTTLALVALGEHVDPDESAHLESCEQCLADVAELIEVVSVGREAPAELPVVPERVWAGIRAELALDHAPDGTDRPTASVHHLPEPAPTRPEPGAAPRDGVVVPLQPRRGRLWSVAGIAAAAGALVGGAVVWAAVDSGAGGSTGTSQQLVAQAVLDPLPGVDDVAQSGQAEVLESADGQVIRVDATALPERDGFYEVWLIDSDVTKLVALGALPAGSVGTFTVPPGVSIEDFPVVDISLEPLDGDPAHSKESLMRGVLDA
jgi:hypothetical protein